MLIFHACFRKMSGSNFGQISAVVTVSCGLPEQFHANVAVRPEV